MVDMDWIRHNIKLVGLLVVLALLLPFGLSLFGSAS